VVQDLRRVFPRLKTFATLSPIPGFRQWLATASVSSERPGISHELAALVSALRINHSFDPNTVSSSLRRELTALCAFYLMHVRHGNGPLDPVARFHLGNGARLERLNWLGDPSEAGLRRSLGLMANYVYQAADVEANHDRHTGRVT
jgi:malonyl-CoA decarboxylase